MWLMGLIIFIQEFPVLEGFRVQELSLTKRRFVIMDDVILQHQTRILVKTALAKAVSLTPSFAVAVSTIFQLFVCF